MDVHAPHHPLHTWKDFWIHLVTITIGLLIALGLEASVEAIHHLHQRHQLEEDLREEARKNLDLMEQDYRSIDQNLAWLVAVRGDVEAVRASHGRLKLPFRPFVDKNPDGTLLISFTMPSTAAWTSARESALVALLPRAEAQFYTRVYYQYELLQQVYEARANRIRDRLDFEAKFRPLTSSSNPDLSLMSPEDLDRESALLSAQWQEVSAVRRRVDFFYAVESDVVNGVSEKDTSAIRVQEHPSTLAPAPAH